MTFCDRLNYKFKCHNIICGRQRLIITEIYLMLRRSRLMMGRFNLKSHIFQRQHHITSCILTKVQRPEIKISGTFM